MTRKRVRNAAAGFAAIVAFFAALAYFTGFQRGQDIAYSAEPELFQDETLQAAYTPLTAGNDPHRIICDGGYGWNGHMDARNDVFCHPFFKASTEKAPILAAYRPEGANISPRNKPRRSLDNAVASAIARSAGLSQVQHSSSPDPLAVALAPEANQNNQDNPPTLPGRFSLAPISPGFSFGGGGGIGNPPSGEDSGGDTPIGDNPTDGGEPPISEPPTETPPAGENPPTETPEEPTGGGDPEPPLTPPAPEEPEMPLPPLDPVDPTPIDPIDPAGPSDVPDPTVVPIPGALVLWGPGLAALMLAARRKRRARASASS